MRTTLTLDDDVAAYAKEESRLLNKPFKQVVNEMMRRAMVSEPAGSRNPELKVVAHSSRLLPGVDPYRLNQFSDELETGDFLTESEK